MKGCLVRVALLPVLAALFYALLSLRAPFPTLVIAAEGAEIAAPLAAFFLWMALLSLIGTRGHLADRARLAGRQIPRDGERFIAAGTIEGQGDLLTAPFTGGECAGYYYNATHDTTRPGGMSTTWIDYEGFALVPSVVRSPLGDLAILAACDKELFHELRHRGLDGEEGVVERAREYLASARGGESIDGPGHFRSDTAVAPPRDPSQCSLGESVIRPGEKVLVAGVYNAARNGIAPDPDTIMRPFHLVPEGEAALRRKVRTSLVTALVFGTLSLAVAVFYLLVYLPRSG